MSKSSRAPHRIEDERHICNPKILQNPTFRTWRRRDQQQRGQPAHYARYGQSGGRQGACRDARGVLSKLIARNPFLEETFIALTHDNVEYNERVGARNRGKWKAHPRLLRLDTDYPSLNASIHRPHGIRVG